MAEIYPSQAFLEDAKRYLEIVDPSVPDFRHTEVKHFFRSAWASILLQPSYEAIPDVPPESIGCFGYPQEYTGVVLEIRATDLFSGVSGIDYPHKLKYKLIAREAEDDYDFTAISRFEDNDFGALIHEDEGAFNRGKELATTRLDVNSERQQALQVFMGNILLGGSELLKIITLNSTEGEAIKQGHKAFTELEKQAKEKIDLRFR